jgi:hypothetical protein
LNDVAIKSALPFEAEYGEDGLYGSFSLNSPFKIDP